MFCNLYKLFSNVCHLQTNVTETAIVLVWYWCWITRFSLFFGGKLARVYRVISHQSRLWALVSSWLKVFTWRKNSFWSVIYSSRGSLQMLPTHCHLCFCEHPISTPNARISSHSFGGCMSNGGTSTIF